MFRKYVIVALATFMVFGTSSCTSKKSPDENADIEATSESGDESLESADIKENNDDLATDGKSGAVADLGGDSLAPEEKLGDDATAPTATANNDAAAPSDLTETPPADNAAAAPPAGEAMAATENSPPPASDMAAAGTGETPPPPMQADNSAAATPEPIAESGESKPSMSLKKVNAQPYRQGKTIVNAYYIARNGDTVEGISQKVFGSADHVKDLCKINQYNCSRGLKVGDKFYYNSPQRPTDDTVVKNFYEDAGIAPQVYTAKAGDNIRKVGKELLGHERGWMELWATNDVESKGALEEGVSLKYWPATDAAPVQTMASTDKTAAPADQNSPPPTQAANSEEAAPAPDMNAAPPPPPPEQASQEALPPPPDQAAAAAVEPPPPPPPPPPTDTAQKAPIDTSGAVMQDPNQTMALGVGAVLLLAAAALFISIRKKKRARQIDFNTTTQTQIE